MELMFLASVSPIVLDGARAKDLYADTLGISFEGDEGDYALTERLAGVKHFGLWPLTAAAKACFGAPAWPDDVPVPQASIEFEVHDVPAAARELQERGYRLLHGARTEPWSQVTARLLTSEGLLVTVCHTPWLHHAVSGPGSVRAAFWQAVEAARPVLASPEVRSRWDSASVLEGMTVGDLAAHLTRAVTTLVAYLDAPAPTGPSISPAAYYVSVLGDPGDLASAANEAVRARSRDDSAPGPGQVLRRWTAALQTAGEHLDSAPEDRLVKVAGGLVLTLDDYLVTRVVELLVHTDDLGVSLGIDLPPPPAHAAELAEHALVAVARERHNDTDVLRALARRERGSPDVLRAF